MLEILILITFRFYGRQIFIILHQKIPDPREPIRLDKFIEQIDIRALVKLPPSLPQILNMPFLAGLKILADLKQLMLLHIRAIQMSPKAGLIAIILIALGSPTHPLIPCLIILKITKLLLP